MSINNRCLVEVSFTSSHYLPSSLRTNNHFYPLSFRKGRTSTKNPFLNGKGAPKMILASLLKIECKNSAHK